MPIFIKLPFSFVLSLFTNNLSHLAAMNPSIYWNLMTVITWLIFAKIFTISWVSNGFSILNNTTEILCFQEIHTCATCGKTQFGSRSALTRHMRIHLKPLVCGKCSYTTGDATHMRQHTQFCGVDGTNYACDFCGAKYRQNSSLQRHRRVKHNA